MSSINKLISKINTKYKIVKIFSSFIKKRIKHNCKDNPYDDFYTKIRNEINNYQGIKYHGCRIRKFIYIDFESNTRYTFYILIVRVKDIKTQKVYDILPCGVKPCCNYVFDTIKRTLDFIKNKKYTVSYIINNLLSFVNHLPNENASCHHDIIKYWLGRIKDIDSFFYKTFIICEIMDRLV